MDFEEFVTLLGPKLSTSGIPEKFHGTDFDTVFWKVGTASAPRECGDTPSPHGNAGTPPAPMGMRGHPQSPPPEAAPQNLH